MEAVWFDEFFSEGLITDILAPLKSGKEASVYIVVCGDQIRCAKVYKEAEHRGFHKLASYQEGRKARGSRDARAMNRAIARGSALTRRARAPS